MTPRMAAALALGGLLIALGVVLVVAVPWQTPTPPRAAQLAAAQSLPAHTVVRGRAFHAALRPGSYGSLAVGLLVALVLGLTPLGAKLVEAVGRPFGGNWVAEAVLGGVAVVLAGQVAVLPFAVWRHVVRRDYGLSTQDWSGWVLDVAKSAAVGAVIGGFALFVFFGLARLSPRWWWTYTAPAVAGLIVLLSFVLPVLVEPVFNRFTPMADTPLRRELIQLAERDRVPVRDVLVADASRRTRAVNAYVSGIGPTRRLVVYDTLLEEAGPEELEPAEVRQVVAHELGHAKRHDVVVGTLIGALGAAAAVCAVSLFGGVAGLLRRAGVDAITQPRAVALLIALAGLAGLLTLPAQGLISRRIEARADAHALALTGDPAAFEAMQRRLALRNLADVDPPTLEYLLFASHPSTVERIAAAREYARTHT